MYLVNERPKPVENEFLMYGIWGLIQSVDFNVLACESPLGSRDLVLSYLDRC
jgi:hypothetical protein